MHFFSRDGAAASPHGLDAVLVGLDEEVLPALPRHVHPAAVVVDDAGVQSRPAHAGLLRVEKQERCANWNEFAGRVGKDYLHLGTKKLFRSFATNS